MKKKIFRSIAKGVGKNKSFKLIDFLLHYNNLSIVDYYKYKINQKELDATSVIGQVYQLVGINEMHGGEEWFLNNCLSKLIKTQKPVLVDVGANIGTYSQVLHTTYPLSKIYSFEPNLHTFKILKENIGDFAIIINKGLSNEAAKTSLYMQSTEEVSSHASMYKEVITDLRLKKELLEVTIQLDTLDNFCASNNIDKIDFLKIDTEGNELKVIEGALNMINNDKIEIIQMEFNEMNIISRVFLKDFYELLSTKFNFFRLTANSILPLNQYSSINEIFRYQDLILINKNVKHDFI